MGPTFMLKSFPDIYPHIRAKFGRHPTVMSNKGGTNRQTDRKTYKGTDTWPSEQRFKRSNGLYIKTHLYVISVRQLHREFLRAGADVMQAFTFYASDDKLENRGNKAQQKYSVGKVFSV